MMIRLRPQRIGTYIALLSVIPTVVLAAFFTLNTINERRDDALNTLRSQSDIYAQLIAESSQTALISANQEYITRIAESVYKQTEVTQIEISLPDGSKLYQRSKHQRFDKNVYGSQKEVYSSIESIDPLLGNSDNSKEKEHSKKLIGIVKVTTGDQYLIEKLNLSIKEDIFIAAIACSLILGASILFSRRWTRKLKNISKVVHQIAEGNVSRIEHSGDDEISVLAKNINAMVTQLQDKSLELEESVRQHVDARADADRSNTEKHAFLGQISNEIMNPLQQINTQLAFLVEPLRNTPLITYVDQAMYHVEYLHGLYDDLLEFYLQNTNRHSVQKRYFSVTDTIERIARSYQDAAIEKKLQLSIDCSGPKELIRGYIFSDVIRFRQIVEELLANAIRYTFEGSIKLHTHFRLNNPEKVVVTLEVIDTGIGIPVEKQALIFEQLQGDAPYDTAYSDTTGLLIAGRTALMIGGSLTLRSRLGEGSVFTFELPAPYSHDRVNKEEFIRAPGASVRVLFASAYKSKHQGVSQLLGLSLDVDIAIGHDQIVRKYQSSTYDVIIFEVSSDTHEDFELAQTLRKSGGTVITPIIALVDKVTNEIIELAEQIGINHVIAPPFRRYDIYRKIAECTHIQASITSIMKDVMQ